MDQLYVRIGNRLVIDYELIKGNNCKSIPQVDPDLKHYVPREL